MKGIVYRLKCKDHLIDDCYIGSSINFSRRRRQHKYNFLREKSKEHHKKVYERMRQTSGWDDWEFQVLEEVEVSSIKELHDLEKSYIVSLLPSLNEHYISS